MLHSKDKQHGFTLIELLVVIVIISVLAMIGMASYRSTQQRARDARRAADIEQVRAALEMYRSSIGTYPSCSNAASPTVACYTGTLYTTLYGSPRYIEPYPYDPKNSGTFTYRYGSNGTTYTLRYYKEVNGLVTNVGNPL